MSEREDVSQRVRVEIKPTPFYTRRRCILCGNLTDKDAAIVELNGLDGETGHVICLDCLAAGPEGAAERTRNHAERLRESADALDEVSLEVAAIPSEDWPTVNDFEQFEAGQEALLRSDDPPTVLGGDIPF